MSITQEDFEAAKTSYTSLQPQIEQLKGQLKILNKQHRGLRNLIHDYMKENELEEVDVGGLTFKIETKTRIKVTPDDLEGMVDETVLEGYRVTEAKLSVKRKRQN
tara:strand:- start:107 stop:421 length:315 start_codon:yes stop_codon:yes gene_type:complete